MNAACFAAPGGPEVLRLAEVPDLEPGPRQLVIRVEAAGVNFIDLYQRAGQYKTVLPFIPGQEAAGTVTALGPGVTGFAAGDRVVCYNGGLAAYAEYVLAPADRVVRLPNGVSAEQGAAVMLQGLTAHYLACTTYPLKPGDTCLVHAAAGGTGLLL
ncbi:MAG TPA: alcohol dehydrogenase catalytic domain-containing protein, partial [Gemmatimonadales bacterium]|nr:alcohol dehydrogenase catalytic domain-containing protein [Gemmatimonadales bacterium]